MSTTNNQQLNLPWRTRISIAFLSKFSDISTRQDGTVNRFPSNAIRSLGFNIPPDSNPRNGVTSKDVNIDYSRNLWFRIFTPTHDLVTNKLLPVIVFYHGGGFVHLAADFKYYDAVCRRFARRVEAVVVSVNYRLAPEWKWPCQYEDGFDVLSFLDDKGKSVLPENADLQRCFLAGDSAGANLSHHVAKRVCESKAMFDRVKVIGVIAIQPFFGGEERTKSEIELTGVDMVCSTARTDSMWKAFLPSGPGMDRDHEAINVSGPNAADITKLDFPAAMVVLAGFDSLKDWQRKYYQWLVKSGKEAYLIEYPNMFHAFYIFRELPEATQLIEEVKQFVDKQCSKAVSLNTEN